jgi:recombination protein RecT
MPQPQGLSQRIQQSQQGQQVATRTAPSSDPAVALFQSMAPEFQKVLRDSLPVETFTRLALTELRANPQLGQCTTPSLLGALMTAARLSLEPGGPLGQFWLTPKRINVCVDRGANRWEKQWQVVPIIGYKGLRDLALRSGKVHSIQSFVVREGDSFRYGSNETRGFWHEWEPADDDEDQSDRPWRGVLTIAQLPGAGKPVWRYLGRQQVLARKASGAAGDKGPWKDHEEAMVRKTGIRAIANDLPSSSIMQEAVRADEQVQVWHAGHERPEPQQLETAPIPDPAENAVDEHTGEVPRENPNPQGGVQGSVVDEQEPPDDDPGPWTPPPPAADQRKGRGR